MCIVVFCKGLPVYMREVTEHHVAKPSAFHRALFSEKCIVMTRYKSSSVGEGVKGTENIFFISSPHAQLVIKFMPWLHLNQGDPSMPCVPSFGAKGGEEIPLSALRGYCGYRVLRPEELLWLLEPPPCTLLINANTPRPGGANALRAWGILVPTFPQKLGQPLS